jgi:hypothetical protein
MLTDYFPRFIGYRSTNTAETAQLLSIDKGETESGAVVLNARTQGDMRLTQVRLTRDEALEAIAALQKAIGLPSDEDD